MKIKELIFELKKHNPEMDVVIPTWNNFVGYISEVKNSFIDSTNRRIIHLNKTKLSENTKLCLVIE